MKDFLADLYVYLDTTVELDAIAELMLKTATP